ncbi:hypothetical protein PVAP13_4KG010600 [Panicum virgatum]|uniref:Uncharacterized protein n=1 Tax=Panicum virgatum TaxID=38727 RepID=A0A8T0TBB6_PANVG|nr:hypothetical protein PVAP13_4KG010600 [Panicum virgatum]
MLNCIICCSYYYIHKPKPVNDIHQTMPQS